MNDVDRRNCLEVNTDFGLDLLSTEDDADGSTGALTMTNVVRSPMARVSATLGDLAGTTPSTGTARYYATDHLGSTRSAWDASKASVGAYEFTPYGDEYNHTGAALDSLAGAYTGKPWDDTAKLFHFPYHQYSPDMARWTSRDPLGMVDGPNVYGYVMGNPIQNFDPDGRKIPAPHPIFIWIIVFLGIINGIPSLIENIRDAIEWIGNNSEPADNEFYLFCGGW
jgi:RHS repeat-associated protein